MKNHLSIVLGSALLVIALSAVLTTRDNTRSSDLELTREQLVEKYSSGEIPQTDHNLSLRLIQTAQKDI
ncbi:hypothetical protein JNK13_05525 [bacterium]|nr:hypothetical protein [bacterium]